MVKLNVVVHLFLHCCECSAINSDVYNFLATQLFSLHCCVFTTL